MHYSVSHGNFDIVSILLDSKVCNINNTNNAGYTCVMLVSLAKLDVAEHQMVVQRLFQMSDVNVRAKKHSQTALMLATSHGNYNMVRMLLDAGADINIQGTHDDKLRKFVLFYICLYDFQTKMVAQR